MRQSRWGKEHCYRGATATMGRNRMPATPASDRGSGAPGPHPISGILGSGQDCDDGGWRSREVLVDRLFGGNGVRLVRRTTRELER